MRRLLRFVLKVGRARAEPSGGDCVLVRGEKREFRSAAEIVAGALRQGWIERDDDGFTATGEGRAALVRMLHPEAGYQLQHTVSHAEAIAARIDPERLRYNDCESPLARLYSRRDPKLGRFLTSHQFAAGERLRADFEKGQLQPRISPRLDHPVASAGRGTRQSELSDFAIDARRRLQAAISALVPDLRGVALDICCFLKGLEQVERERKLPPRSAKLLLRAALSTLADHYGFAGNTRNTARPLHWGAADYRPTISPSE